MRSVPVILLLSISPLLAAPPATQPVTRPTNPWIPVARLDPSAIREASGIVESRKRPGVFWTHGDSGTPASIVAFDLTGRILARVPVAAPNNDWEDICADDQGHLYIADIGSAGNTPVRRICKIAEPDPKNPPDRPIPCLEQYRFPTPTAQPFDAESLFCRDGRLYVIAKLAWMTAPLYRLQPAADHEVSLVPVTSLPVFLATGADVSDDGKRIVICSYLGLRVFPLTAEATFVDAARVKRVAYPPNDQIEACCFHGNDVILIGETGRIFHITDRDIESETSFVTPDQR